MRIALSADVVKAALARVEASKTASASFSCSWARLLTSVISLRTLFELNAIESVRDRTSPSIFCNLPRKELKPRAIDSLPPASGSGREKSASLPPRRSKYCAAGASASLRPRKRAAAMAKPITSPPIAHPIDDVSIAPPLYMQPLLFWQVCAYARCFAQDNRNSGLVCWASMPRRFAPNENLIRKNRQERGPFSPVTPVFRQAQDEPGSARAGLR